MGESDEKHFSIIHIDAGDWTKPANTLIEKISDAIGAASKPWQIRRVAQAEAEAEKIHAAARIEITKREQRALARFIAEESKKQQNIESIIYKALPDVGPQAKSEEVEDDWITNFFDKCRLISDEDMQTLWGKILAGEANSPGKFSKRAVALLASLDKADATKFTKLCGFTCSIAGELAPIIYEFRHEIYANQGLDYPLLSHLDTIGLIRFSNDPDHFYTIDELNQRTVVDYFAQKICIEFREDAPGYPPPKKYELAIGRVILTDVGQQLFSICAAKPVQGFLEFLKQRWGGLVVPCSPGFVRAVEAGGSTLIR